MSFPVLLCHSLYPYYSTLNLARSRGGTNLISSDPSLYHKIHLLSSDSNLCHQIPRYVPRSHLISPDPTLYHQIPPYITRSYLISPDPTLCRQIPHYNHQIPLQLIS